MRNNRINNAAYSDSPDSRQKSETAAQWRAVVDRALPRDPTSSIAAEAMLRNDGYAALKSRDLSFDEIDELALYFAAACGWPKAAHLSRVISEQRSASPENGPHRSLHPGERGNTRRMLIRRVARPMLSAVFISRGVEALRSPQPAADATRQTLEGLSKLPDPVGTNVPSNAETVARVNAAVQIGGGLLLATGKLPRVASAALALTVVPGSLGGHAFWNISDPARKAEERRAFITDISLIGGLIIAAVDTEGRPSLGWRGRRAARKVTGAVSAALPTGAAAGSGLTDSQFAEKVNQGLHVGAERGRELAHLARERGGEWAEIARERGHELAEVARDRGPELADIARERGGKWADAARERGHEIADVARDRAPELAEVARDRSSELADLARARAEHARSRASELADTANVEVKKRRIGR